MCRKCITAIWLGTTCTMMHCWNCIMWICFSWNLRWGVLSICWLFLLTIICNDKIGEHLWRQKLKPMQTPKHVKTHPKQGKLGKTQWKDLQLGHPHFSSTLFFVIFTIFQISHSIQIHFKIPRLTTRMLTPDNPLHQLFLSKIVPSKIKNCNNQEY